MATPKKPTTSRPEVLTIDVVYMCGHSGQRREIVYPLIGTGHALNWIKGDFFMSRKGV